MTGLIGSTANSVIIAKKILRVNNDCIAITPYQYQCKTYDDCSFFHRLFTTTATTIAPNPVIQPQISLLIIDSKRSSL